MIPWLFLPNLPKKSLKPWLKNRKKIKKFINHSEQLILINQNLILIQLRKPHILPFNMFHRSRRPPFPLLLLIPLCNLPPTSNPLFSPPLHSLLLSHIHLHLNPQIQLLIYLVHTQPNQQPCLLDQRWYLVNILTHVNQILVYVVDSEGGFSVLLVDEPSVGLDELVTLLKATTQVLEDLFQGDT